MTSPIETAAEKIRFTLLDTLGGCNLNVPPVAARAAFESIDADQLADVILAANLFGDGTAMDAAQAVKNWLTGKVLQQ